MERINWKRVKYLRTLSFNGDLVEAHAAMLQVCKNDLKKERNKSELKLGWENIFFFFLLLTLTIQQWLQVTKIISLSDPVNGCFGWYRTRLPNFYLFLANAFRETTKSEGTISTNVLLSYLQWAAAQYCGTQQETVESPNIAWSYQEILSAKQAAV